LLNSASPALDAGLLLGHVLGRDRGWLLAHSSLKIDAVPRRQYRALIRRRAAAEPVAYLRGHKEWFGLDLEMSPDALVPRPETELLVEAAIELAWETRAQIIADIGTGSGAIAVALACQVPHARVEATDITLSALAMARRNIERMGLETRVSLHHGDLLSPLASKPDLIVANLPYLSADLMESLPAEVGFEPAVALSGGHSGLEAYERLFIQLRKREWFVPLVVEIEARQGAAIRDLVESYFPRAHAAVLPDYAGLDRIVVVRC
jgi:release factor glutamine methyltransferase